MKRTASLLLGLALIGTTTGCYCMPYYGAGGTGFPLGCPPGQPTQMMPTPAPVPATGFNTMPGVPVATPVTVLPAPAAATTPVVIESLPTFR
ncbi:MAG: hypothetical protein CMJ68_00425 [Planctomycetaceae bacterium]|nr:hypothetical protein [Planctomycetaceae bacterium]|tara:strand:- start:4994 stop:5269 length:276 start_codon:yes stop_codon:yes gene_type:complete